MRSNNIVIVPGDPEDAGVDAMIRDSDAYYASLYPAESNHLLDVESLKAPGVFFFVARAHENICGFGSVVHQGEYGELKRMYVRSGLRGAGIGRRLLVRLEAQAIELGLPLLRLETGIKQPEAIALYRSHGYREIEAFGPYRPDPLSLFMEKQLSAK